MAFDQQLTKVVVALCDGLDTPLSMTVKSMVKEERFTDLVGLSVRPQDYQDAESYFKDAICVDLLRKCDDLPTGIDRRKAAVETFYSCEKDCRETNRRLSHLLANVRYGFHGDIHDLRVMDVISVGRRFIEHALGAIPVRLDPIFGPGATFYDKGLQSTILHKLSSRPTRTSDFWWADHVGFSETKWGLSVLYSDPRCNSPRVIEGNRFTTVPKDSKKFRGICVEPSLNISYQLAVGGLLKQKLKRVGVDLLTAQDAHRLMAQKASVSGSHATIDLSNASDTVAKSFVELMLPHGWHGLLDDLRSKSTKIDGRWVPLQKFSSMGNGFTFELETLLFLSIVVMACHVNGADGRELIAAGDVRVFGDDIIVPSTHAPLTIKLLKFFGFTPNANKTFLSGKFRESCGGDYFDGQAVRPFYLKEIPNEPAKWIVLANGLRRLGISDSSDGAWRFGLLRPWLHALDAVPGSVRRLRGPRSAGDLVIHDHHHKWCVREIDGCRQVRAFRPVPGRRWQLSHFPPSVQIAAALYGVPSQGIVPRDSIAGYKESWIPLLEVDEFGIVN